MPFLVPLQVNSSGQFCGVAEMISTVDFNRSVDFWQQDKWVGQFKVKWHVVKDVPNGIFRHLIIPANENKPVTNSRDTQEVRMHPVYRCLLAHPSSQNESSLLLLPSYCSLACVSTIP